MERQSLDHLLDKISAYNLSPDKEGGKGKGGGRGGGRSGGRRGEAERNMEEDVGEGGVGAGGGRRGGRRREGREDGARVEEEGVGERVEGGVGEVKSPRRKLRERTTKSRSGDVSLDAKAVEEWDEEEDPQHVTAISIGGGKAKTMKHYGR